jgi:hypothetical protein
MGLGFVMLILGMSTIMVAQGDRTSSWQRKESSSTLAVTEGGMARTLAQLTAPNNAVLLNRNYDTINPKTNKTYLGPDGIANNGDEEAAAINEWAGYNPSTEPCYQVKNWGAPNFVYSGTIGAGSYSLKAYRYNPKQQEGTLLIEATQGRQSAAVVITISVTPDWDGFPGVVAFNPLTDPLWPAGTLGLRGRQILGSKANVYYSPAGSTNPALTGNSAPGDATRATYLDAMYSSPAQDGATGDTVAGTIFACSPRPWIPSGIMGTNFGVISTSQTLRGVGGTVTTAYQIEKIDLDGDEVLTVDTTGGPVQIDVIPDPSEAPAIVLRHNAKILNIRTDGKPPQVGDLRILSWDNNGVELYDQSCIQTAFIWLGLDDFRLLTSGPGCPGGQNTNFEGVLWAETILSSKNAASNRNTNYLGGTGQPNDGTIQPNDGTITPGATSGFAVPDDVSSLSDLFRYINWPVRYKFGGVTQWQRVRL